MTVMFLAHSPNGRCGGEPVLDLAIAVEFARRKIDRDHLAGTEPALLDDARLVDLHHAGFRAGDEQSVGGHV